jgi:hypothetical protein
LLSEQGEAQIGRLGDLRAFLELDNKICDKQTLLVDIRNKLFSYTVSQDGQRYEMDLESPRVKNLNLKPIFCLAYFTMTHVTV